MSLSAQKLCRFLDSALERGDRKPWPAFMELFNGIPIGKHGDHLGNAGARSFNGEFPARAVRLGLKVFVVHSMSIVAIRLEKVK